ncbi:diaminopimelate decarboxylase [Candidatus Aerophobetes bacterium]|nr:diaminopimelate decarboxylase [Candidatus Aerophobetes bacterium]
MKDILYIGQIKASEIADKYGTPLYVYNEDTIKRNYKNLIENIKYPKTEIYYACKANYNLTILKILKGLGAGIDAVSPWEVELSIHIGFSPSKIFFTGNNVTDKEIKYVKEHNVLINIDSLSELKRYGKMYPNSKISVRINPNVGAGHHIHVITGGPNSKFGIYYNRTDEIKQIVSDYNLDIIGVHMHIGSGILEPEPFLLGIKSLLTTAKEFNKLDFIDIGGGLGIPYKPEEKPLNIKKFGQRLTEIFTSYAKKHGDVSLRLELGRYLVANSGVLITRVNTVKKTPYKTFIGTDTGFNHLIRPMLYNAYHEIVVVDKMAQEKTQMVNICGNICENGDLFAKDRPMPDIEEGDLLAIMNAGAYGFSMSSNYNFRPLPAEVLVLGNEMKLIRRRETIEDLWRCYE